MKTQSEYHHSKPPSLPHSLTHFKNLNFCPFRPLVDPKKLADRVSPTSLPSAVSFDSVKHVPVSATVKKVGQSQFYSTTPAKASLSSTPSDEEEASKFSSSTSM